MPVTSREKKRPTRNISPQKVIIPKGMVNPKETTIIEIPSRLHRQPIVIAKHKNSEIGYGLLCSSFKSTNEHVTPTNSTFKPILSHLKTLPERILGSSGSTEKRRQGSSRHSSMQVISQPHHGEKYNNQQVPNTGSFKDLEIVEERERSELQRDLEVFQRARRNLLENTSKLTSNETSNKLMKK
ncbi:uncharacterized protein LOC116177455 [Photinus pyralis]|uniref:Uncharacterized protein n=1 Tax=Photinus pyralis TaxID=7054 RepID=A0A1Y1MRI7_PHOPY|nr:uncharacterized protein LOC116177455 [Photinus pyralis]